MLTPLSPKNLKNAWKEFISTGQVAPGLIRPVILQSWQRCQRLGINPQQTTVLEVLDYKELESRYKKNHELINVATPIMQKILNFVRGTGFIITLADNEGYLLKVIGDKDVAQLVEKGNFKPGANWSEKAAGTNAIGTSIISKKPLQIFSSEHYCRCSHNWTCSSSPIKSPISNELIGVLTMTGHYQKVHCHTLGMVYAAVHAIENELALRNAWTYCEIANNQKSKIINSMAEGMIAINQGGRITQVNKICCQLLGFSETRALHQEICSLLGPQNRPLIDIFTQDKEVTDQQVIVYNLLSQQKYWCTVTSRLIKSENKKEQGKVVLLSEIKRAQKLVQQMIGNQARFSFDDLIGDDPRFTRSIEIAKSAAESTSNVLLIGPSGTGKEMFAQAIHNAGPRKNGPFLAINCSGMPRELIGSELFGYADGAFTGAKKGGNPGKFELASGGTLFLDEIGDMPLELQPTLLRVLEEKRIMRLGGSESVPVDVRIISATNKDLWEETKAGNFRDDLFYRLNVLTINMIPLRERREDITKLIHYFLNRFSCQQNKEPYDITPEVLHFLQSYHWPGNVRQLQNALERMANITKGQTITTDLLPQEIKNGSPKSSNTVFNNLQKYERQTILELLETHNSNISQVARELNIARSTLYRKLKNYGLRA